MDTTSRRSVLAAVGTLAISPVGSMVATAAEAPVVPDRPVPVSYGEDDILRNMMSGGVGKDGIPSIDDPSFLGADSAATTLDPGDPVFGVVRDGVAKAYPQNILVWHEVVNDRIADTPVAVTYCPLTGTAQGVLRGPWELGVSGQLVNSNLVMYDRETDTLWPQMLGWGVNGPHSGAFLEEFRVIWTSWEAWRDRHPDTQVLSEDTGHIRDYGEDPYGSYNPPEGYYRNDRVHFPLLHGDDRMAPKVVVMGARTSDGAIAARKASLRNEAVLTGEIGDHQYTLVYDEQMDTGWYYRSEGAVEVTAESDGYAVDGDSGYRADQLPLTNVLTMDSMWFPWVAYFPDTAFVTSGGSGTDDSAPGDTAPADDDADGGNGTDSQSGSDGGTPATDGSGEDNEADPPASDQLPGFGLAAGAAGIGAGWWLARNRRAGDGETDDTAE